jgi:proteasome assembly chaperone (PAC2) family protein
MADEITLDKPWLVAMWPGMGHVALNAGVYLLAKLGMTGIAEFQAGDLFDVEQVEVKRGLIQPTRRPRNRFFAWKAPPGGRDLVVFLGEAQPPLGKYPLCRQIVDYAKRLGTERVLTFAAMATRMRPEDRCRVFGAATDAEGVQELRQLELEVMNEGNIGGLNGVLLGAAAEAGLRGACFLGEMPHVFAQLPFPKASLAILEVFVPLAGLKLDLSDLEEQAHSTEEQLGELLTRVEQEMGHQVTGQEIEEDDDEPLTTEAVEPPEEDDQPDDADRERIEALFEQARKNRSKAFELKQFLDRLGVFKDYEDRFLDLFKTAE